MDILSYLSLLEPSTSEVCSVESFRAALGTSCTGAIAVINAIGKSLNYSCATTPKTQRNGGNMTVTIFWDASIAFCF